MVVAPRAAHWVDTQGGIGAARCAFGGTRRACCSDARNIAAGLSRVDAVPAFTAEEQWHWRSALRLWQHVTRVLQGC